jgi:hypothetical protein
MLAALQLVIGVAAVKPPPKRRNSNPQAETSEETKRANREQVQREGGGVAKGACPPIPVK